MCSEATRTKYTRLYRAASSPARHRLVLTLLMLFICAASVLAFSDEPGTPDRAQWFTPQNILTVGVLVYHLGMLRSQFNEVQKRLDRFENNATDLYAPKDETFRRLETLERRRVPRD